MGMKWNQISSSRYIALSACVNKDMRILSSGEMHGGGFYIEHGYVPGKPIIRRELEKNPLEGETKYFEFA
jgi:hypothetical protein